MENQNEQNQNPIPPVSTMTQTPPIQTPPGLDSKTPKSKLPILIIGIILFLLIAGSAAGFYVFKQQSLKSIAKPTPIPVVQKQTPTPTPDPTANWKTYTNSLYSYTVKYPLDFIVDGSNPKFVWIGKNIYATIADTDPENCLGSCPIIDSVTDTTVNNLKSRRISGHLGEIGGTIPQKYQMIVIQHNGKFYTFTLYAISKDIKTLSGQSTEISKENVLLFDQILSTFKFTDTQTLDTSNWKTYTNPEFKFEFKYPNAYSLEVKKRDSSYADYIGTGGYISLNDPSNINGTFIYINVSDNSQQLSIEDFVQNHMSGGFQPSYSSTTIAGISSKKTSFPGMGGLDQTILIPKGDKIYSISASGPLTANLDSFYNVLSTFKFKK